MSTPKKLIYILLVSIFLSGFCVIHANNENPDQCEKEESDEEEECPDNESTDNGSFSLKRAFGKIPWEDKPGGRFNILRVKPSPILVTPEALRYNFWGDTSISSIDFYGDDYDNTSLSIVVINHLERMYVYDFFNEDSTAVPKGSSQSSLRRLVLEDSNGNPVSLNLNQHPTFYVDQLTEYYGDGSCRVFDFATGDLIRYCDENGRIIDLSNPDYGVEVIRNENSIRQVKAPEGLADVVVLSDEAYEINYYTFEDIGTKDTDGYYQPTGTPYKTFKLENIDPEPDSYNHIRVTETYGSKSWITEYNYSDAFEQWEMVQGNGLRRETKYLAFSDDDTEVFIRELRDQAGNVVSKTQKTVKNFSWDAHALRVAEVVQDPDGIALTKTIDYYDDAAEEGRYSRRKSTIQSDGFWTRYDYDTLGRKIEEAVPWLDSPIDAPNDQAKITEYSYTPVDVNDVPLSFDTRPRTVMEKTLGVVTARTFYAYLTNDTGEKVEIEEKAVSQSTAYGDPGNHRTTRTWYASDALAEKSGRLKSVAYPDGTVESYDYALDQDAGQFTEIMTRQATLDGIASDVANKSTRKTKTWDFQGNLIKETFSVYTGIDYELVATTIHTYDDQSHLLELVKDGRVLLTQIWENGELVSVTDESGTETQFSYDALKRMSSETKVGHGTQLDVLTLYTRDLGEIDCGCDGKMTKMVLAGDLSLETRQEKDRVGRISSETDTSGYTTTYSYANGGRTLTKTNPNTSTVVRNRYLDGRVKSITGDGVVPEYYTYGVNPDGTTWTRVDTAEGDYHEVEAIAPETELRFVRTTTDMLGHLIKEERPAFKNKSILETTYTYNDRGLLAGQTQTGMADTLFEYDVMATIIRSGLDLDDNGQLDLVSVDRITDSNRIYQLNEGAWYDVSTTKVYPVKNDPTTITVSTSKRQLSGFTGTLVAREIEIDVHGNQTVRSTAIDRADKTVSELTDTPFSTIDAQRVIVNELLLAQNTDTVAAATTYTYDALERLIAVKEPRHTNSSQIEYYTGKNQIFTRTDADGRTTAYKYYQDGTIGAGEVFLLTNPLGQETYFRYNKLGSQGLSWGAAVYPQKYSYNKYGELTALTTWRDTYNTYDFSARPWPQPSNGDTTSWSYDVSTGLLNRKKYADGTKVRYNYNADNRLTRRTWAREGGLRTIYRYNSRTGELTSVDYEDPDTADITYRYDRLGRQTKVTDATGTRTFNYDPDTLQLVSESLDADFYEGHQLLRQYDSQGRTLGYELQNPALSAQGLELVETAVNYTYDPYGRLSTVSDGSDTFTYGYTPDSNLLASITAPRHSVSYTYEANRDLMTIIDNQASGSSLSRYEYGYDALGRRSNRMQSGGAINSASTDAFSYNDRSEVIGSTNSVETTAEWNPTYSYDKIGNRISSTGIFGANYTANSLNQYDSITPHSSPLTTPSYDADGNLLSNSEWTYTWNNENRLTSATDGKKTLSFTYDYQGRLVRKDDGTDIEVYLYDNWNRIFEICNPESQIETTKSFLWGLDLSVSLQGAGGVGGLLKETEYDSLLTTHSALFCIYDAAGNVMQKLDSEGETAMSVAYDPFGNIIEGKLVGEYGFSTKPLIDDLNWYYYGFRYYDPVTGRWPSRDPIEEIQRLGLTGLHNQLDQEDFISVQNDLILNAEPLYAFVENEPIGSYDKLGLRRINGALIGPAEAKGENDNCCLRVKKYWQAYHGSLAECIRSCSGNYGGRESAYGSVAAGVGGLLAAKSGNIPAAGILGTASVGLGVYNISLNEIGCSLACKKDVCTSIGGPTYAGSKPKLFGKCEEIWECPSTKWY